MKPKKKSVWKGWGYVGVHGIVFYDHCPCIYNSRKRAIESCGYPDKEKIVKVKVTVEMI